MFCLEKKFFSKGSMRQYLSLTVSIYWSWKKNNGVSLFTYLVEKTIYNGGIRRSYER